MRCPQPSAADQAMTLAVPELELKTIQRQLHEAMELLRDAQPWTDSPVRKREWQERCVTLWKEYHR